jgi:hypothetical protein
MALLAVPMSLLDHGTVEHHLRPRVLVGQIEPTLQIAASLESKQDAPALAVTLTATAQVLPRR